MKSQTAFKAATWIVKSLILDPLRFCCRSSVLYVGQGVTADGRLDGKDHLSLKNLTNLWHYDLFLLKILVDIERTLFGCPRLLLDVRSRAKTRSTTIASMANRQIQVFAKDCNQCCCNELNCNPSSFVYDWWHDRDSSAGSAALPSLSTNFRLATSSALWYPVRPSNGGNKDSNQRAKNQQFFFFFQPSPTHVITQEMAFRAL